MVMSMSKLTVADNVREPWSRITDTSILRPRDALKLIGRHCIVLIGVLDSHNPSAETPPTLGQVLGLQQPPLPNHHHILVQLQGATEVLSSGLYVGQGDPQDLIFAHITSAQKRDDEFRSRLGTMTDIMRSSDNCGLYYVSGHESLSALPEAQRYIDENGGLLRRPSPDS